MTANAPISSTQTARASGTSASVAVSGRALGPKPGDRPTYVIEDGEVRIRRPRSAMELFGMLSEDATDLPMTPEEMDEAIAEAAAERGMAGLDPNDGAGVKDEP